MWNSEEVCSGCCSGGRHVENEDVDVVVDAVVVNVVDVVISVLILLSFVAVCCCHCVIVAVGRN